MTLNSECNDKYTASRMTSMRDIFTVAAKIKKSFAYKFTRLDESNNHAASGESSIYPVWRHIPLKPPLIDRHLAVNVKYFCAFRAFIKLTKDFYEIHPYPFGSIAIYRRTIGDRASVKTGCVCAAVIGKTISPQ